MRWIAKTQVASTLASIAVTICISWAFPAHEAAAQSQIKFGGSSSPPSMVEIPFYVAKDRGFFKEEGIDVVVSAFTGDPIAQRALIAGEVDIVNTNLSTTIAAAANGATIKAVASQVSKLTYLFIARKGVSSVRDLAGKTVAVSAPGALSYHVPRMVLEKYGVSPDSVTYVAVGSDTQRFQALAAGRADASILHVVRSIEARNDPSNYVSIADIGRELPDLVQFYFSVTDKTLAERPDLIKRFLRANVKATRWVLDNKDEAVKAAMKVIPNVSEQVMSQGYDMIKGSGAWDPNLVVDEKAVKATHDLLVTTKVIPTRVPAEKFVTARLIDEVLKELGRR